MSNSKLIREAIKQKRKALPQEFQEEVAQLIYEQFAALNLIEEHQNIACYLALQGEVATNDIINSIWQAQKNCYLPKLSEQDTLVFSEYKPRVNLTNNQFGIPEPDGKTINAGDLDLVIVPLVAFDSQCNRIGMGKGYYDRTFAFRKKQNNPILVGLAYDMQKVESIETNPWDIALDLIITPSSVYTRKMPQ